MNRASHHKTPSVLMFGWEMVPFNSGGLGVACEGLSKALAASGVDLTFVLPVKLPVKMPWCKLVFANETDRVDEEQMRALFSGYQSHAVDSSAKTGRYGLPSFVSGSLMQRVKAYALKAPEIAKKCGHSVIHAHDWLTYPAGIAAKEASGKPLVVHVHATEFDRCGSDNVNREVFNIEKEGFRRADAIVTVSNRTRDVVIKKYGVPARKVRTVYNGVEFQKSAEETPEIVSKIKKGGGKIVLYAGRITLQKGPDYFVQLAKKVLEFEPNTYFVVSGSGDMESSMIKEVSHLGLAKNFIFCGFLRGKELATIYRESDIYVMPSVSEPFGILPLECMVSDTPVLVSKESGVSEVVSCALKSHFWDIDDMTDKVVSVLRHHRLQNHLSVHGRAEVKEIHWYKAAQSLISLYNSLDDAFSMLLLPSSPAFARAQVPHI